MLRSRQRASSSPHQLVRLKLPGPPIRLATDPADQVIGSTIRDTRLWEPTETALLCRIVKGGEQAADIGAHIGYFTVLLSRLVGPAGHVVAFEPEPGNFELLKANCILNGCANSELHARALVAEPGRYRLFLSDHNRGDHRLAPTADRPSLLVDGTRFDDLWRDRAALDFAKIDAQGFEIPILLGMAGTIRASAARLVCLVELSPRLSRTAGHGLDSLLRVVGRLGAIVARLGTRLGKPTAERLDGPALAATWAGLLAAPREDAGANLILTFSTPAWDRLNARLTVGGAGLCGCLPRWWRVPGLGRLGPWAQTGP
jgi:FkbM family methyltransferase